MTARQQGNGDGLYLRLGVLPGASHDEVARAYRRLAHDAHPDAHPQDPDAPRRFREITEAYEVLGHPASRQRYDHARRPAGVGTGGASEAPGESPGRPGAAQVHASRIVTGGPTVFLGAAPVNSANARAPCWPSSGPGGPLRSTYATYARRCRRGLIGAAAVRHVRAKVQLLMEWPELDHGIFAISVAAELSGLHPQTLRIYEREGLIEPGRSAGGTRLYSGGDVTRLREIAALIDGGLNIAGIKRVLELEEEVRRLQAEVERLSADAEHLTLNRQNSQGGRRPGRAPSEG